MSTTPNLLLTYIVEGQGGKEITINTDFLQVDTSVAGYLSKSVAGSTDITPTDAEALYKFIKFTGALTGNINVIFPSRSKEYIIWNATTGSHTLSVKTSGGSAVLVGQDTLSHVSCDGVEFYTLANSATLTGIFHPRVQTLADATSFAPNIDDNDEMEQANTQSAGTLTANSPTGTPFDGQTMLWEIKCTNVQTWSFNSIYIGSTDLPLPTTTSGSSKTDTFGWRYSSSLTKWMLLGLLKGF